MRRNRNKEAGQTMVLAAIGLVVLMGFAGLGIDMGLMRYQKRLQQTAADAAAVAGASNLASSSGGITAGAQAASSDNGYADNSGGATCTANPNAIGCISVTVNNPPASGPHSGDGKYVEVLVAAVHPTYFMNLLNIPSESISARAVATNVSGGGPPANGCVYTLGPPSAAIEGVNIVGHATLNATTCGIADNGNLNTSGCALTINSGTFSVSGTADPCSGTVHCADQSSSVCPAVGAPAAANPLASLTPPCSPCTGGTTVSGKNLTLTPGTYNSITFNGNGTSTFNPGIYIINGSSGGISCSGTPTINGTGVMFYFTNGATFNCQGNDTINLTAPSPSNCAACASQYDGILMYQDPNDTAGASLGGNTGAQYNGVLYFPKSEVTFYGNNSTIAAGVVVAEALGFNGNPTVNLEGTSGLQGSGLTVNAIKTAVLVE